MIDDNRTRDYALEDGPQKEAELTLGPWLLAGLACALFVICAVCFSAGYMMGRRNASPPGADKTSATDASLPSAPNATNASAKPEARGNAAVPAPAAVSEAAEDEEAGAGAAMPEAAPSPGASSVHPALPSENAPASAARGAAVNGWMVQIASVAHQEDADVLASALRRRGYAVVERRVSGDSLIHVQVGPFTNRADANAMAQRLLGDGYNAAVQ